MKTPHLLPCFLFAITLMTGCVTPGKYHVEAHAAAHKAAYAEENASEGPVTVDFEPITLEVGEKRLITTEARGTGFGGWFHSVTTKDFAVAKPIRAEGGKTYLKAVAPGETTAFYGNGAIIHREDFDPDQHGGISGAFEVTVVASDLGEASP